MSYALKNKTKLWSPSCWYLRLCWPPHAGYEQNMKHYSLALPVAKLKDTTNSVVDHLPSMCKAPSLIPHPHHQNKTNKKINFKIYKIEEVSILF
jgi:hypothetical protein